MGISTGQITSALSTQNRTLSPITSQRCQLIQSDCPSSDAGHSHRQLITEKMRLLTSEGRAVTTCWSVTILHVAPQLPTGFLWEASTSVKAESHSTWCSVTFKCKQQPLLIYCCQQGVFINKLWTQPCSVFQYFLNCIERELIQQICWMSVIYLSTYS